MTNIESDERPCIICNLCNTFVATGVPGANPFGVIAAFEVAINIHVETQHPNMPAEDIQFMYGLRKMNI